MPPKKRYGRKRKFKKTMRKRRVLRRGRIAQRRLLRTTIPRYGRRNALQAVSMQRIPRAIPPGQKLVRFSLCFTQDATLPNVAGGVGLLRPVNGIVCNTIFSNAVDASGNMTNNAIGTITPTPGIGAQLLFPGYRLYSRQFRRFRVIGSKLRMTVSPKWNPVGGAEQFGKFLVGIAWEPQAVNSTVNLAADPDTLSVQRSSNFVWKTLNPLNETKSVSVQSFYSAKKSLMYAPLLDSDVQFYTPGATPTYPITNPYAPIFRPTWYPVIKQWTESNNSFEFRATIRFRIDVLAYVWDKITVVEDAT